MELPKIVELTRCESGVKELAYIETLNRESAKNEIDAAWWDGLGTTLCDVGDEPDSEWEWRLLVSKVQNKPYYRAKCVRSSGGSVEAAMLFRVDALSILAVGERAVFVDRLATAPRNRDQLVEFPVFRGGGTGLLVYAVAQSYSLGFDGRVNLIPVANELFYRNLGFEPTNVIASDGAIFELPARTAMELLEARGLI